MHAGKARENILKKSRLNNNELILIKRKSSTHLLTSSSILIRTNTWLIWQPTRQNFYCQQDKNNFRVKYGTCFLIIEDTESMATIFIEFYMLMCLKKNLNH